ncbi:SDR family NAD(P)-dependent oxidoreductase [Streptomyces sp. URMC 126]|uniref:SDR family NAD(P)-dependent oxidoreductase n=1 Tax=Streptomyces sp. URMC 126 TaxID=3423401 RepID=UPI003F198E9B
MTRYAGRNAVVLDGTTGLGLAVAKRLVEGGARVLLTGRPEDGELAAATAEVGSRARIVGTGPAGAATTPEALAPVVEDALGSVDFVFVHAGTGPAASAGDRTGSPWGSCRAVRALLPYVHGGGAIVFTADARPALAAASAAYGKPVAGAEDGGPWACARALAAELAGRDIRVNAVVPGLIALPGGGGAAGRAAERHVPMRRAGTVDEVARAALFLAAEATYTTGARLVVDGGLGPAGPDGPDLSCTRPSRAGSPPVGSRCPRPSSPGSWQPDAS